MDDDYTPRGRVIAAIEHREPDRVPLDLGGNQTGIHRDAYRKLIDYYGIREEIQIMDAVQQLALPSERVLRLLDIDTRYVRPGAFCDPPELEEVKPGFWGFRDAFGVVWAMPGERPGEGLYCDIVHSPFAGLREEDVDHYDWPRGDDPAPFKGLREHARKLREETGYALVSGITGVIFEYCWYLRGFENLYMDLVENPGYVERLLDRMLEYWLGFLRAFLDEVGEFLDVICVGDDIGMQSGPLFPPETYRDLIKPRQRKLYDFVRSRTKAKLWYHSCGAVREYIPDFIEMGIDILNPVQVGAYGMDAAGLKEDFGDRITFWGGGIDTQRTFPFASPEDVCLEVAERMEIFKPGGGYVFNCVHNIQPDVPVENIVAFWEAAREFRWY